MRIVWKDSPRSVRTINYRNCLLCGTPEGWTTNLPGDNNIYASNYSAKNAIDKRYGDYGNHGTSKRKNDGIKVIGKKDGETA